MEICHRLSLHVKLVTHEQVFVDNFIDNVHMLKIWKKNFLWWVFPWQVVEVVGSSLGNTKMTSVSRFWQQFSARTERRRCMIPYLHMINCVSLYIFWPLGKHIHNWDMPFVCLCLQLLRLFQLRCVKFLWKRSTWVCHPQDHNGCSWFMNSSPGGSFLMQWELLMENTSLFEPHLTLALSSSITKNNLVLPC